MPPVDTNPTRAPHGSDPLAVRVRYLRDRRVGALPDRAEAALWVALAAVVAWLFIAGFTGLSGN